MRFVFGSWRSSVGRIAIAALIGAVWIPSIVAQETPVADPAQAAADARIVETLLRVRTVDPNSQPKLKSAVIRYLDSVAGSERQVEVAEALKVPEAVPGLVRTALANPDQPLGIAAGRVALKLGGSDELFRFVDDPEATVRAAAIAVLGGIGDNASSKRLIEVVVSEQAERTDRQGAITSLLASRRGQEMFAGLLERDEFPESLKVVAAAEVSRIGTPELRERLAGRLELPVTADATPLPPLDELVRMTGEVESGRMLFFGKATCGNCHVVGTEGKEVGPNLSEIGAKLSREAMFVSILDPSAAISHNFESFVAETIDGEILQGILVSRTDEEVALKLADGQLRTVPTADIDRIEKQTVSLMPAGLQQTLTAQELVSVVDYLMTLKPMP